MKRITEVHLWGEGARPAGVLPSLHRWAGRRLPGARTTLEGEIRDRVPPESVPGIAARIAAGRVFDLNAPLAREGNEPLPGEAAYEARRFRGEIHSTGILYDAFHLSRLFRSIALAGDGPLRALHVIVTDRLVGTFDRDDRRYHARCVAFGYPHVLSTTGVVQAPARPRAYYRARQMYGGTDTMPAEIAEAFRGRFLEAGDPRIVEALKGYLLQCLFYQATGEPFCGDPACRLFNAHWQEELLFAQIESGDTLCGGHEAALAAIAGGTPGGT